MLRPRMLFIGLAAATTACAPNAPPGDRQQARWQTLGAASLRLGTNSEIIQVRGADWHRQVRLCVDRRAVRITDARIEFTRGASQRITGQQTIRAGDCSFAANLRGSDGLMREIRLNFFRMTSGSRPLVRVQVRG